MRIVSLICRSGPAPLEALRELVPWLRGRGLRVLIEHEPARGLGIAPAGEAEMTAEADLAVVLGGDGTMLRAARMFAETGTPLMGVNLGGLGFITQVNKEDMYEALERALSGDCPREERMMLSAHVIRGGRKTAGFTVLNDIVLNKGKLARLIDLEARVDGTFLNVFKSDGLVVSTPTGSTAYSLSAGGPIIYPTTDNIVLTPICPHTLTNRPIVLPGSSGIEIRLMSGDHEVLLTLDGQAGYSLVEDDVVMIGKSAHKTVILQPLGRDHFWVLRSKLRWGERQGTG